MNLALAADVRLAGTSARFDTRFLQLGIHPGGGHTWMLRRIVGPQVASAMVLFGEVLSGPEAAECGLAWRCVEDDDLIDAAMTLARRAAAAPPELVRRTKATIAAVAPGISGALITTVFGLIVALPALIAFNLINKGLDNYRVELYRFAEVFMRAVETHYPVLEPLEAPRGGAEAE